VVPVLGEEHRVTRGEKECDTQGKRGICDT
jgi:hypothetical protein